MDYHETFLSFLIVVGTYIKMDYHETFQLFLIRFNKNYIPLLFKNVKVYPIPVLSNVGHDSARWVAVADFG